jgi:hypothetical protein
VSSSLLLSWFLCLFCASFPNPLNILLAIIIKLQTHTHTHTHTQMHKCTETKYVLIIGNYALLRIMYKYIHCIFIILYVFIWFLFWYHTSIVFILYVYEASLVKWTSSRKRGGSKRVDMFFFRFSMTVVKRAWKTAKCGYKEKSLHIHTGKIYSYTYSTWTTTRQQMLPHDHLIL